MARQTIVRPLGLITQPNTEGQYPPGAFKTAHNVFMRDPGIVEAMPESAQWVSGTFAGTNYLLRLLPRPKSGIYESFFAFLDTGSSYEIRTVRSGGTTTVTTTSEVSAISFSSGGTLRKLEHLGNYYFTTQQGVFVVDLENDETTALIAGLPPPSSIEVTNLVASGVALTSGNEAAWRCVFVRDNGRRLITGPPSNSILVGASGGDKDIEFTVSWNDATTLQAGDKVELYRTTQQTAGTDPGARFQLAVTAELTASDITAQSKVMYDRTTDDGLGKDLYTNDGQEGATAAKFRPAHATDVTFFRGHAFYIQPNEIPKIEVSIPVVWGVLSTAHERTYGIGVRATTGNTSTGVATITGIGDLTGVVPGMYVSNANFPDPSYVVSVDSGTQVTLDNNATGTSTGSSVSFFDVMEINGDLVVMSISALFADIPSTNPAIVLVNKNIIGPGATATNVAGAKLVITSTSYADAPVEVRATNGQNYSPELPEIDESVLAADDPTRGNVLRISEEEQPEAIPVGAGNELFVGAGDLYRAIATKTAVWVFASDGLFRVSGVYPDWVVDPIDASLVLADRDAVDLLHDVLFARTNRGLVSVSDLDGVRTLSQGVIGDQLTGVIYAGSWDRQVVADQDNFEIHVYEVDQTSFLYNTITGAFTTIDYDPDASAIGTIAYHPDLQGVYWTRYSGTTTNYIGTFAALAGNPDTAVGAEIVFQPITGSGESFGLKEWIDITLDMSTNNDDAMIVSTVNGNEQSVTGTINTASLSERDRLTFGVTFEAALSETMEAGFTSDYPLGEGVAQSSVWRLYGVSFRWVPASEESKAR